MASQAFALSNACPVAETEPIKQVLYITHSIEARTVFKTWIQRYRVRDTFIPKRAHAYAAPTTFGCVKRTDGCWTSCQAGWLAPSRLPLSTLSDRRLHSIS